MINLKSLLVTLVALPILGVSLNPTVALAHNRDHDEDEEARLDLTPLCDMSFGTLVPAVGGQLRLRTDGVRETSGGVLDITSQPGYAARYLIKRKNNSLATRVEFPDEIWLKNRIGQTVRVDQFSHKVVEIGRLGDTRVESLTIGATLHTDTSHLSGQFEGQFEVQVTVDYE